MREKSGSPYPPGIEATRKQGVVKVFGIKVELLGGDLITKRDAQQIMVEKLEFSDRQARAAVSSKCVQDWTGLDGRIPKINEGFIDVRSFVTMVQSHMWLAEQTSEQNLAKSSKRQGKSQGKRIAGTFAPDDL